MTASAERERAARRYAVRLRNIRSRWRPPRVFIVETDTRSMAERMARARLNTRNQHCWQCTSVRELDEEPAAGRGEQPAAGRGEEVGS